MIKFMDLNWQHGNIKNELMKKIENILNSNQYIFGEELTRFESEFADYCGVTSCVGVGNGTDALEIAIESLQLPPQSTVLVPANSFIASAEAVTRCNLKVKFIPFDAETMLISLDTLSQHLDENVSAVVVVHLYGNAVDVKRIRQLTDKLNIKIIEDCAQAHGALIEGVKVGGIGHVGCFSFYPGKNLGALGDAGAVVTNDELLAERVRRIANHGRLSKFDHEIVGRNSRLDNLQAGVLRLKLEKLDSWNKRRQLNADLYFKYLDASNIVLPKIEKGVSHVFHHFVIRTDRRDCLKKYLLSNGVETGIHYPKLIPATVAYRDSSYEGPDFSEKLLSIPVAEHLKEGDIKVIAELINKFNLEDVSAA